MRARMRAEASARLRRERSSEESAKAATLAGCTSIEHGAYITDDVFNLMAEHGTYYDPNVGLVLQNYLENKPKFFGIGNYYEEGFAFMEKGVAIVVDTFKKSLKHQNLKIIYGTDATAGGHGDPRWRSRNRGTESGRPQNEHITRLGGNSRRAGEGTGLRGVGKVLTRCHHLAAGP